MKKTISLLALLLLASPAAVWAKPVSVTFYPEGAVVTEEETFPSGKNVVLTLPAGADASGLSVSLSSGFVQETRIRTEPVPSPAMKALQKKREKVQSGLSRVAAERESLTCERLFWADPPMEAKDGKALEKQAGQSTEHFDNLAGRDTALSARERKLERQLRALEARMEAVGRGNDTVQTCALTVRDAASGPLTVRWSYALADASWQPSYRVLAEEKTGTVRVLMDAVLRQQSGADWKDVDVTLASAENLRRVNPPSLPDWVIGEERPVMRSMNLMAAKSMDVESAVQAQGHATGLIWNLGRMDVPAEGTLTRAVAAHDLAASFCRLVRPLQEERAYFTAALASGDVPLLPAGQALFFVNGIKNAQGVFSLAAGEKNIFFGADRRLGVRTRSLPAEKEGTAQNTQVWRRSVDITSSHDAPVSVRVEIAAPILRNSAMRLTEESTPKATPEDARYVWLLDIPAGKSASILQSVTVTLPEEKSADTAQAF